MSLHLRFGRRAFRRHLFQVSLIRSSSLLCVACIWFLLIISNSYFLTRRELSLSSTLGKMIDLSLLTLIREEMKKTNCSIDTVL